LLKKKFDPKSSQVIAKNNVSSDLTIESTVNVGDKTSGEVKTTYKNKDFGQVEAEVKTEGALSTEIKAQKLYDGLTVTVKASDAWSVKTTAEFKREPAAVTFEVERANQVNKDKVAEDVVRVGGSAAVGFDGFAVGAGASYKHDNKESKGAVEDYNFGSEYTTKDYTLTLKTENSTKDINGSFYYAVPTNRGKLRTLVGGQFIWDLKSNDKCFAIVTEHDIDEVTGLKAKATSAGALATVLEHRLSNPNVKLALAATWDKSAGVFAAPAKPTKLAVGLTLGDY